MQTAIQSVVRIFCGRQLNRVATALGLLLMFGSAQSVFAQNQLNLANNYFVTGDYVVAGVGLRGLGVNGMALGTINIPDKAQFAATGVPSASVPPGADIVAAFLYWETVESNSPGATTGQQGFFNHYAITGTVRGDPNAPTSWSTGGCSGSSQVSKTMVVYRADVRPYLNLDANGNIQGNGSYDVQLPDSGSNGGGVPLTLGASLVIIYRVQSPAVPLNSIVLYDGALAPNNSSSTMTLPIVGFYEAGSLQAGQPPISKITHIVGNGQANKSESVLLNTANLGSLYQNKNLPPFPGLYNGSWDNPTWTTSTAVPAEASSATAQVVPSGSNSGCVNWGAVVFSTTVQSNDGDGLLDVWKQNKGYKDVNMNQWVALPDATKGQKDLFVELDYLSNIDGLADPYKHSHLPKLAALDQVGDALKRAGVRVHFDLGAGIYQGDQYVISYPLAPPLEGTVFPNAGGNAISESLLLCTGDACAFPGQVTVGWKGSIDFVQTQTTLGNFQLGRKDSYHYVLFGHTLGAPRTYWSAIGAAPSQAASGIAALVSITVANNVGTVVLNNPAFVVRPGDAACTEASCNRVTVEGALQAANTKLNGVYKFASSPSSTTSDSTTPSSTTFTIQTSGVANGKYDFSNEPQLGLTYGGPTSDSGFSDIGGGDSTVTFGSWLADDVNVPVACQPDPTQTTTTGQVYCTNQVGTVTAQAGTLLHELGHTLFLSHGGTFFVNGAVSGQQTNQPLGEPTVGVNCNPGYLSSMNYLFQIRGFPDGGIDYSGQTLSLPGLTETTLSEITGLGTDMFSPTATAAHFSRWYAPPNALDTQLQNTVGGHFAGFHCDGSPITDGAQMVRVDGSAFFPPGSTFSAPIDWNHNLALNTSLLIPQDVDFNGSTSDAFKGFNDWVNLDLRQIGVRADAFGLSGGSGSRFGGGGSRFGGGGSRVGGGGSRFAGGGSRFAGGGTEQDTDTANSTADAPTGLTAGMSSHSVLVKWTPPEFGQIRSYSVWRAVGSFKALADVFANRTKFTNIGTVKTPTPPATSFLDGSVKNNTTYTYFVVDMNKQGAQSVPSATA